MAREPRRPAHNLPPEPGRSSRQRFALWHWLRNSFFAGIVAATPVAVTVWLVYTLIHFVDRTVKPLIPPRYQDSYVFAIPGAGVLLAALVLTLLGAFTANIIGRSLLQFGERIVARVPFVRETYGLIKQVVETVFASNQKAFKEVVLIEYPRRGLWTIGFLSSPADGELAERLGPDYVGVFVPTIPNPTSGFILWTLRSEVTVLDMTVEEGAKLILSAGIVTPESVRLKLPRRPVEEGAEAAQ
jgi:uncharacterized membrane protein